MRAAHITQYGEPKTALEIVDVNKPEPGPDELRIQVERVALNHLDIFARRGHPSDDDDDFPKQTGCDIAGTVDMAGSEVEDNWEGANVVVYPGVSCGDCEYCLMGEQTMCSQYEIIGEDRPGGLAEYVVVPERCVEALPAALDFETAAAVPIAFTTAWRMMIATGGLRPAESALVLGASGGVGNAALQIADRVGATVYATTSTEQKAAQLRRWADEVIDYTETPFVEAVAELTDGRGVDIVADHVGEKTWQESIDSLAMGGRMVICGATSGADPDIDIRSVYQAHRQIRGAPMGNRSDFRDVLSLVARNELVPQVYCTLPLEDIAVGHRLIENREVIGKIIIDPTTSRSVDSELS